MSLITFEKSKRFRQSVWFKTMGWPWTTYGVKHVAQYPWGSPLKKFYDNSGVPLATCRESFRTKVVNLRGWVTTFLRDTGGIGSEANIVDVVQVLRRFVADLNFVSLYTSRPYHVFHTISLLAIAYILLRKNCCRITTKKNLSFISFDMYIQIKRFTFTWRNSILRSNQVFGKKKLKNKKNSYKSISERSRLQLIRVSH